MNNNNNNNGLAHNDNSNYSGNEMVRDKVLMAQATAQEPKLQKLLEYTPDTWIADSGASCHITNDNTGLYDVEYLKVVRFTESISIAREFNKSNGIT